MNRRNNMVSQMMGLALVAATVGALPSGTAGAVTFQEVWTATGSGPYQTLPQYESRYSKFFQGGVSLLERAANRTLNDDRDILPRFQKLVHPLGICFAGTWSITAASPYSGYFAQGAKGLIIVRASEALGETKVGGYRAFGLAGKIFPTLDPQADVERTANFFTVDDLGGTLQPSFLDDTKTNQPKTSVHLSQLAIFSTITEVARVFRRADADPGIRQVYPIAELGLANVATARTPYWFAVTPETRERNGAADFRNELRLARNPSGLRFGIYVAERGQDWRRLGTIQLDQEALADGCDHQLHFPHPRWR